MTVRAARRSGEVLQLHNIFIRPQGGSEVNFEISRYVVELDLNFQMLLFVLTENRVSHLKISRVKF